MFGVDRLGEVVGSARIQALLAVALHRFGGQGDYRQSPEFIVLPDLGHRLITVHLRHHDIHQDDGDVGIGIDQLNGFIARGGCENAHAAPLEHAAERKDIPGIIINEQDGAIDQIFIGSGQSLQHALFGGW